MQQGFGDTIEDEQPAAMHERRGSWDAVGADAKGADEAAGRARPRSPGNWQSAQLRIIQREMAALRGEVEVLRGALWQQAFPEPRRAHSQFELDATQIEEEIAEVNFIPDVAAEHCRDAAGDAAAFCDASSQTDASICDPAEAEEEVHRRVRDFLEMSCKLAYAELQPTISSKLAAIAEMLACVQPLEETADDGQVATSVCPFDAAALQQVPDCASFEVMGKAVVAVLVALKRLQQASLFLQACSCEEFVEFMSIDLQDEDVSCFFESDMEGPAISVIDPFFRGALALRRSLYVEEFG